MKHTIYVSAERPEVEVDSNICVPLSIAQEYWKAEEWTRDGVKKQLLVMTYLPFKFLYKNPKFDPRPSFLQRNDLQDSKKSKGMVLALLRGGFLPQIILRYITPNQLNCLPMNGKLLQLVDGLQRYSALARFVNGGYGVRLGLGQQESYWKDLNEDQQNMLLDFNFQAMLFVNASNQVISQAFRDFNQGSTALNTPEINNSIISQFINATRNAVDGNEELGIEPDSLYARKTIKNKQGEKKEVYKYFNTKTTNKRFDVCDFDHTLMLCADKLKDPSTIGWFVPKEQVSQEIESRSKNGGRWELNNELWQEDHQRYKQIRNKIKQLFSSMEETKTCYMKKWQALYFAMTFLEYGDKDYSVKGTKVDYQNGGLKKFVSKWFEMAVKWNDENVYLKNKDGSPRMQFDKNKPMESFDSSFGGFNINQYETFKKMFTEEWLPDDASNEQLLEWGLNRVDSKRKFNRQEVLNKWHRNDCRCWYTDEKIESEWDLEADHIMPHSQGGSTDIDNCAPISRELHKLRNTMPIEEFIPYIKQQGRNISKRWQYLLK